MAVTGGGDRTVRVWDLASGRPRGQPLTGHTGSVSAVAVGEVEGRAVAVTGSDDDTVRVWDLASGRSRDQPLTGHTDSVMAVAVGEVEGRAVAVTGGGDGTVRVWDLASGGCVMTLPVFNGVGAVALIGDGLLIGAGAHVCRLDIAGLRPLDPEPGQRPSSPKQGPSTSRLRRGLRRYRRP